MAGRIAPGPRGRPIIGSLSAFRADPIGFLGGLRREHGDVARFRLGKHVCHLVAHPRGVRHVLQDNSRNYGKQTPGIIKLRSILGNGLLTSEGAFWLRQRRIAQPAFRRERIAAFAAMMAKAVDDMRGEWEGARGGEVDVAATMMKVTLRIVSETLFGTDVSPAAHELGRALTTAVQITQRRIGRPFEFPRFLPLPEHRQFRAAMRVLDRMVEGLVADRRRSEARPNDLLSTIIDARDPESGEGMTDRQIRDEIMTILLAGHETTANTLTWTFHLLASHPAAAEQLTAEVDAVVGDRTPGAEDATRLPYLTSVLDEALRLYPPGWLFARSAIATDEVGGYEVPAGSIVFLCSYLTHRHPDFWDEPERFSPERFHAATARDRFAYFPFSGGPRQCIGAGFAMQEMQLLVAMVAQRWHLRAISDAPVGVEPLVTLRPRGGLRLRLEPRGL